MSPIHDTPASTIPYPGNLSARIQAMLDAKRKAPKFNYLGWLYILLVGYGASTHGSLFFTFYLGIVLVILSFQSRERGLSSAELALLADLALELEGLRGKAGDVSFQPAREPAER